MESKKTMSERIQELKDAQTERERVSLETAERFMTKFGRGARGAARAAGDEAVECGMIKVAAHWARVARVIRERTSR
ncbi:MAG: hypothetical protein GY769_17645 [bacterium]|nr:hypothetical protein [bacterium]